MRILLQSWLNHVTGHVTVQPSEKSMNNINTSAIISTSPRRYDIDALRIFAFTLLILYHVSMLYALGEGWHVKSAYQTDALQIPRLLVNQWRMSLLFVISGLAVSFVWQRYSAGRFAARRTRQLLVPLLFGMALWSHRSVITKHLATV